MKRRIMAWILGVVMLVSMLPTPAMATEVDVPVEVSEAGLEPQSEGSNTAEPAPPQTGNSSYNEGPGIFEESRATAVPTAAPEQQEGNLAPAQPGEDGVEPTAEPGEGDGTEEPTTVSPEGGDAEVTPEPTEVGDAPAEQPAGTVEEISLSGVPKSAFVGEQVKLLLHINGTAHEYRVDWETETPDGTNEDAGVTGAVDVLRTYIPHSYGTHTIRITVSAPDGSFKQAMAVIPVADHSAESQDEMTEAFRDYERTGNWNADMLAIAKSQIGYAESERNFYIDNFDVTHGYTRYGAFYGGAEYEPWDALFVNFVARMAGIPEDYIPRKSTAAGLQKALSDAGAAIHPSYILSTAEPGDLVFVQDANEMKVGVLASVSDGGIRVILGDCDDRVQAVDYESGSVQVLGFGDLSVLYDKAVAEHAPTEVAPETQAPEAGDSGEQPRQTKEPEQKPFVDSGVIYYCGFAANYHHVHDESCYQGGDVPLCGMFEHVHTEKCTELPLKATAEPEAEPSADATAEPTAEPEATEEPEVEATEAPASPYSCGMIEHVHGDECYDHYWADIAGNKVLRVGDLICEIPEHTHTEACLAPVPEATEEPEAEQTEEPEATAGVPELICGKEEHDHAKEGCEPILAQSSDLYGKGIEDNGVLVDVVGYSCGKEQHIHTAACYATCGMIAHTHGPECYDGEGNLICELPEHTHGPECQAEAEEQPQGEAPASSEEDSTRLEDIAKKSVGVEVSFGDLTNEAGELVGDSKVEAGKTYTISFNLHAENYAPDPEHPELVEFYLKAGTTYTYDLPEKGVDWKSTTPSSGSAMQGDKTVFDWQITGTQMQITLTSAAVEYVTSEGAVGGLNAFARFEIQFTETGGDTVQLGDYELTVSPPTYKPLVVNKHHAMDEDKGHDGRARADFRNYWASTDEAWTDDTCFVAANAYQQQQLIFWGVNVTGGTNEDLSNVTDTLNGPDSGQVGIEANSHFSTEDQKRGIIVQGTDSKNVIHRYQLTEGNGLNYDAQSQPCTSWKANLLGGEAGYYCQTHGETIYPDYRWTFDFFFTSTVDGPYYDESNNLGSGTTRYANTIQVGTNPDKGHDLDSTHRHWGFISGASVKKHLVEDRDTTTGLPVPVNGCYHFEIEAHIPEYNSDYGLPIDAWYLQDNMGLVGSQDVPLGIQDEEFAKELDELLANNITITDGNGEVPVVVGTPNYDITDVGVGVLPYSDRGIWTKLEYASKHYTNDRYIVYIAHRVGGDALSGYTIFCRFWLLENGNCREDEVKTLIEEKLAPVKGQQDLIVPECYGYDSAWTNPSPIDLTITYSVPKEALDNMIANYLKAHPGSNQVDGYLGGLRALKNTIYLANWDHMLSGKTADLDSDYAHIHFQGTLSKTMILSPNNNDGVARFEIRLNENHMDLNNAQTEKVDYYELSDKMTGLLLQDNDTMEVIAISLGKTESEGKQLQKGTDYELIVDNTQQEGSSFKLQIKKDRVSKDDAFVIRYNALAISDTISNEAEMKLFGQNITATSGKNVKVFVNASVMSAQLKVEKNDAVTGKPVNGAKYGLFATNGTKIHSATTGEDGIADLSHARCVYHMPYYIQETDPADGYALNPTKHWIVFCNTAGECSTCEELGKFEAYSGIERIMPAAVGKTTDPIGVVDSPAAAIELPVRKVVTGEGAPGDVKFTFLLKPNETDETKYSGVTMPTPDTIEIKGGEKGTFGAITFQYPGTYAFRISEVKTDDADEAWTYDDSYWIAMVYVEYADESTGKLTATASYYHHVKYGDGEGETVDLPTWGPSAVMTFENKYIPQTTSMRVTKVWEDADDQDGIRPESIKVQLYADSEAYDEPVELNAENGWTYTWPELPKYEGGKDITYTVAELDDLDGYAKGAAVYDEATSTFTITNTHVPDVVDKSVTKVWDDADDQDGLRPEGSVQVRLTGTVDGKVISWREATLNAENDWSHEWKNLPKNWFGGKEIDYEVEELNVPEGYEVSISETGGAFTVTNVHVPGTVSRFVEKVWNDGDDRDDLRPESIRVRLTGTVDGEIISWREATLNDANKWSHEWKNLPENWYGGRAIDYTVEELNVPEGYTPEIKPGTMTSTSADRFGIQTTTEIEGFIITNTHTPDVVSKAVAKVWDDADDQDGIRPESIEVQLLADGEAYGSSVTLSDANEWKYTWTNLPAKAKGTAITYTVAEVNVPEGYAADVTEEGNAFTVTNTHMPETTLRSVTKVWEDKSDQDGKRPDRIQVRLTGTVDGKVISWREATLNAENGWSHEWTNLPKNWYGGNPIDYTVEEFLPDGSEYALTSNDFDAATNHFTLTNMYTPEETQKTVTKVWDDADDQDGLRPESIQVALIGTKVEADGTETEVYRQLATLNAENGWTQTWPHLSKYANGTEIVYTVEELGTISGYVQGTAQYDKATSTFTITNAHTPEVISKSVTKVWDDADDRDGLRPGSIQVRLTGTADGEVISWREATLNDANNWSHEWTNLPVNWYGGNPITYTVEETEVPAGYEVSYATTTSASLMDGMPAPQTTGFIITNTHVPGTVSRFVEKVWHDGEDQDGIRSDSVRVRLTGRAGKQVTSWRDATLNEANGWRYEWTNLPENWYGGTEIAYTVEELDVPAGYTATYADSTGASLVDGMPAPQMAGYVITNTHTPDVVEKSVTKVWADNGDSDGLRPESIRVQLLANGEAYGTAVELNDANGWSYTWTNLPKKASGTDITYTVTELSVLNDYATTYDQATLTITNAHTPATVSRTVVKVWNDNNNQDGVRATQVTARLLADGEPYNSESVTGTVVLSAANNWQHTWEDLPRYRDGGVEIVYSVEEVELLDGGYTATYGQTGTTLTITNTHTPSTTFRTVTKVWDDEDDAAGLRTPSVTVQLRDNGANLGAPVVLSEANDWSARWDNLPEFRNGQRINYTVVELNGPAGYTTTYGQNGTAFTVTNHYRPVPNAIDLTGTKIWVDGNNARGLRPNAIEVTLYQNGTATANVPEWTKNGNTWTFRFANLPRVDENGTPYVYTVRETPVDGYTMSQEGTTITNTIIPRTISIEGRKIWDDNDDAAGLRPTAITVRLLRDGTVIQERRVTAENDWRYSFEDLPESDPETGRLYVYTISERMVNGYYARVEGYNLVNRLLPTPPPTPDNLTTIQNYEPPLGLPTEEALEDMIELLDYGTPLWGDLLSTGDELPVYPFAFGGIGLLAVLALILGRKKRKKEQ